MPVIYLSHPRHGNKVAFQEAEAKYDEENGWTRYDPNAPGEAPVNGLAATRRRPRNGKEDGSDGNGG